MRQVVLAALGVSLAVGPPAAAKDCDRACTLQVAEAVLAALQSGQPGKRLPRGLRLTENGRDIRPPDSQLAAFRTVTWLHAFAGPSGGMAGFNGAAEAYGGPAVFSVRIKLKGEQVTEVETLVVRRTEAPVFAPQSMAGTPAWDQVIPPERRRSRADLIATADAWLSRLTPTDDPGEASAPPCDLTENGARSTPVPMCRNVAGLGGATVVRDRRWPLVDETRGLVWGLAVADLPNGTAPIAGKPLAQSKKGVPHSALTAALFRIDAGGILAVELVVRDLPLGATTGWALPKPKKSPARTSLQNN